MKRRDLLASGALIAGSTALSGCLDYVLEEAESKPPVFEGLYHEEEQTLPVTRRFDRVIEGVRQADGATLADRDALRSFLEERDLAVDTLSETEEGGEVILELAYTDERHAERGSLYGLGVVAGGYAALVADETADKLVASLHDEAGATYGEFEVETTSAERFRAGDLSVEKYASSVTETLEATT